MSFTFLKINQNEKIMYGFRLIGKFVFVSIVLTLNFLLMWMKN